MDLTEKVCSGCGQAKAKDQFDMKIKTNVKAGAGEADLVNGIQP